MKNSTINNLFWLAVPVAGFVLLHKHTRAATPTIPAPQKPHPYKYGVYHADLKDLQNALNKTGATLTVDGIAGPLTLQAWGDWKGITIDEQYLESFTSEDLYAEIIAIKANPDGAPSSANSTRQQSLVQSFSPYSN